MKRYRLARAVRATLGKLVPLLFSTRVIGAERIPTGGALLAGNHVSCLDPVLLWCVSPRPVHFMAKSELFVKGFIAWLDGAQADETGCIRGQSRTRNDRQG